MKNHNEIHSTERYYTRISLTFQVAEYHLISCKLHCPSNTREEMHGRAILQDYNLVITGLKLIRMPSLLNTKKNIVSLIVTDVLFVVIKLLYTVLYVVLCYALRVVLEPAHAGLDFIVTRNFLNWMLV